MIAQFSCIAPFLRLLLLTLPVAAQLINCQQAGPPLVSPAETQQQLGNFIINPPPEDPPLLPAPAPVPLPQQPASSVWFQANSNPNNLNSNHIDPRHEQPSGAGSPRVEEDSAHQINEHTLIQHPNGRLANRAELSRLERRVDRLEFELRKSLHQIQLLKNEGPDAARASGIEDSPTTSYQQQVGGNKQAPSHLGHGDKDDQQERRASSSGGTILSSGGNSDIKLIDLSERLNLVEKFITITTSKMYEMEQSQRQLERCECRQSCKWPVHHAPSSPSSSQVDSRPSSEQDRIYSHQGAQHKTEHQRSSARLETMAPRRSDYSPMNETITQQQQRDHVLKSDGQIWQDERNKCNVCSCHRGHVGCKRVACPELKCDNPQQVPGECCPVCLKSCTFKQRLVKHGHKLVINSNEQTCKECLCSDGRLKCQRVDQVPPSRMQRNAVNDDMYDGMYDDEYDDPEAVASGGGASSPKEQLYDQYDGSNEDEDEPNGQDLGISNEQTTRRRVELVKREASDEGERTHSIRRNKRTRWRSRGERANELEENDRSNGESDHSTSTTTSATKLQPRTGPLFCPLVDCEPRDQFKLENDCCTYCRGFDFCAYDFHRTWSTAYDSAASTIGSSSSWSRRCHPQAKCTNTNIYESLLAGMSESSNSSSSDSSGPTGSGQSRKTLTINSMFTCECATGFAGDGTNSCQDIDECASPHLNDCDPKTTRCVNTPGSYECQCRVGFKPLGGQTQNQLAMGHRKRMVPVVQAGERRLLQRCADINECSDGKLNGCHTQARCLNTPGSYRCHCKRGYLGNGFECHKWFSSGPNVAAYLHRHEGEAEGAQPARLEMATESENQTSAEATSRARVALPPLNTLDEDDEQDDDRSDWPESGGLDLDSPAEDFKEDQTANDENSQDKPPSPRLSESKWEPLKFGFDFFGSAGPETTQQLDQQNSAPTASETERAGERNPQGPPPPSSLNTRTMFFQPPPPMPRPRPWWDEPTTTTTTTTTTATTTTATTTEPPADTATDVTEKQTTRLEGPDAKIAAASQQSPPNQSDIMRTDPASLSLSKQGGATTLADGTSAQARPTEPQQATARQPPAAGAPRRGTIIATASITPRRGGSPSNGRAYLSSQQHYRASSGAAPSLPTSSILGRSVGVYLSGLPAIFNNIMILTLLVLIFGQQLFCMQFNHIVTVYSF